MKKSVANNKKLLLNILFKKKSLSEIANDSKKDEILKT